MKQDPEERLCKMILLLQVALTIFACIVVAIGWCLIIDTPWILWSVYCSFTISWGIMMVYVDNYITDALNALKTNIRTETATKVKNEVKETLREMFYAEKK